METCKVNAEACDRRDGGYNFICMQSDRGGEQPRGSRSFHIQIPD